NVRHVRDLGMRDEEPDEAHHFLHRAVRVIEKGASLMHREFVDERSSGRHGFLADPGHAVLFDRNFQTVPVQGSAFRQCVFKHNANTVAARDLDGWAGTTAVVAPHVDGLERRDLPFERRGLEAKDLYAGVELKGQLRNIRSHHRHWREWGFGRATRYPRGR